MSASATGKKRIVSGMRPTGNLHLGNYEGALKNWIRLQDSGEYECFYFIADLHALTSDYADTSAIKQNTLDMVSDWIAAGLDPERCARGENFLPGARSIGGGQVHLESILTGVAGTRDTP